MTSAPLTVLRVVIGLNQGGVQQAVLNLFRGLDRERFTPIACAIENSGAIGKEIEAAGFEVVTLGYKRQPWRTIGALKKLMVERKVAIAHGSSYHPGLYARIAGVLAGVPVLINHEHVVFDQWRLQRYLANRALAPRTDAFVAVGQAVANQVQDWYGYPDAKMHVIHNGVDIRRFHPAESKREAKVAMGMDPDRLVIGMVARIDAEKGHRYLFEAISRLAARHGPVCLLVGTGRGEDEIRSQAEDHGVAGRVQFLGLRRDVPELLRAFDIFAFPTLKEGFPNALLEAMASGCAIVASDFPGNLEMVRDGANALVAPMGDVLSLECQLERLIVDEELRSRLGAQARADAEREFSVRRNVERTSALYEDLWQRKGCSRG